MYIRTKNTPGTLLRKTRKSNIDIINSFKSKKCAGQHREDDGMMVSAAHQHITPGRVSSRSAKSCRYYWQCIGINEAARRPIIEGRAIKSPDSPPTFHRIVRQYLVHSPYNVVIWLAVISSLRLVGPDNLLSSRLSHQAIPSGTPHHLQAAPSEATPVLPGTSRRLPQNRAPLVWDQAPALDTVANRLPRLPHVAACFAARFSLALFLVLRDHP